MISFYLKLLVTSINSPNIYVISFKAVEQKEHHVTSESVSEIRGDPMEYPMRDLREYQWIKYEICGRYLGET